MNAIFLILALICGWPAAAETRSDKADVSSKLAAALGAEVYFLIAKPEYDYPIPVIVQMNRDFFDHRESMRVADALQVIHSFKSRLRAAQILRVIDSPWVEYVTLDAMLRVSAGSGGGNRTVNDQLRIIGADQVAESGITGEGVTVAVFDSGFEGHSDIMGGRLKVQVDFTSGTPQFVPGGEDDYGHGHHVDGIIGGTGSKSKGEHAGVAPGVSFVSLQVVGADGSGRTSNLIQAIDWVIAHRDEYQIQVANLSLGHPPIESYLQDPLCQAVEQLVEAGVITVVSAGNLGKDAQHPELWGAITSPGNSPAVITVGAVNDRGTLTHTDDVIASYSSRGPTYLDGLFKPDLVAPGNQIASTSAADNLIANQYPDLLIDNFYMYLSGSSMATAFVSGVAALMKEANPALTPRLAKAMLQLSAIRLTEPHHLEQGHGMVNALTAVEMAQSFDVALQSFDVPITPYWELDGELVWSGGAVVLADGVSYSELVDPALQGELWGSGFAWVDALTYSESSAWASGLFDASSPLWDESQSDASLWSNGLIWADSFIWIDGYVWADAFIWAETAVDSNAFFWSDGFLWSDAFIWSDATSGHDYHGDS